MNDVSALRWTRELEKIQTRKKNAVRENALRENALVNDDLTNVRSYAGMDPRMTRMASAMIWSMIEWLIMTDALRIVL